MLPSQCPLWCPDASWLKGLMPVCKNSLFFAGNQPTNICFEVWFKKAMMYTVFSQCVSNASLIIFFFFFFSHQQILVTNNTDTVAVKWCWKLKEEWTDNFSVKQKYLKGISSAHVVLIRSHLLPVWPCSFLDRDCSDAGFQLPSKNKMHREKTIPCIC